MDTELFNLIKRVEKNGIAFANTSKLNRSVAQKTDFIVYKNRRTQKTVIINEKKLKKLLGTYLL